jgi:hypothetical protein
LKYIPDVFEEIIRGISNILNITAISKDKIYIIVGD